MKIAVVSPKSTQESAQYIAEQLRLWHSDVTYFNPYATRQRENYDVIVNYGCSGDAITAPVILNPPITVGITVNKLRTFELLEGLVELPYITTDKARAIDLIQVGHEVVIRETATGSKSAGTTHVDNVESINNTPAAFYSKYIPHTNEFRINCFRGSVLTVQNKTVVGTEFKFKLLNNYQHPQLKEMAQIVHKYIGVDMYGIDALLDVYGRLVLLEVNSGPILFGKTSVKMVNAITSYIEAL